MMDVMVHESILRSEPAIVPQEFITRIVEELHPVQIWLFGSRAKGTARPDSDWDLFVVLPDTASEDDLDGVKRWPRLRDIFAKRVELITTTKAEFDRWKLSLGTLDQIVNDEGFVVYGD